MLRRLIGVLTILSLIHCGSVFAASRTLVSTQDEYRAAIKQAEAGDSIVLANGIWPDFEIAFSGNGLVDRPISLEAETPGKVILSGRSNLRLGGSHLKVSGLVFRDGYSPSGEVISFRLSKKQLATQSRVTETVIDRFNNPDRFESDYWVAMYGRENRFDHNHLIGKTNAGVTMAVRLDSEASRNNHHRIDHNYFGPRPVFGSNGGETLRIGTSAYSMFASNTVVEFNYFERCNGEVEIISNKSGSNTYRGNIFYRSQGSLTLRHGDGNKVVDNIFLGEGEPHSGGIRVINRNQIVRNNYMENLMGSGFASALTVMNGVPDSPVNRYVQVSDARIEHNTVVASHRVALGAGSDEERSAPPVSSRFADNLLSGRKGEALIAVEADVSGIEFKGNLLDSTTRSTDLPGFSQRDLALKRASNGLLYPADKRITAGVSRDLKPVLREQTGVSWYPKAQASAAFGGGRSIEVMPGEDTLSMALESAADGDTLRLGSGDYRVSRILGINRTLTILGPPSVESAKAPNVATIHFSRTTLFELRTGGRLSLGDLTITGDDAPDAVGNSVIRSASLPAAAAVTLELHRVRILDLDVNNAFNVISLGKSTLAENILISGSEFGDVSGSVLAATTETDDFGRYNIERVSIDSSDFHDIDGAIALLYRGGTDESTFGPHFEMRDSRIANVGLGKRNSTKAALLLHGVQEAEITQNQFTNSAQIRIVQTVGIPKTRISHNRFVGTPAPEITELVWPGATRAELTDNQFGEVQP